MGYMSTGYGFFPGGDPRQFNPDEEMDSPQELENHRLACEAWDKGDQQVIQSGCMVMPDGSIRNISHFGLGTYWREDDECPDCGGEGGIEEPCEVCGKMANA